MENKRKSPIILISASCLENLNIIEDNTVTGFSNIHVWPRYIFQDLGRFEVEIGDSKNMGGL